MNPAALLWRGRKAIAVTLLLALGVGLVYATGFEPPLAGPEPLPGAPTYVALGDSYSAGEGLFPYRLGTRDLSRPGDNNRCHRSDAAYGALLAGPRPADDVTFQFRACSGAVIADLTAPQTHTQGDRSASIPAQLDPATLNTDAQLVTITIGGNDAGFAKVLKFCALHAACYEHPKWQPDETKPATTTIKAWAATELPAIAEKLDTLYATLRTTFPRARIIVLGYPRLFDEQSSTAFGRRCLAHRRAFDAGERTHIRELGAQMNGFIANAAIRAGLEYVETADAFAGHETCGPDGPWIGFLAADASELADEIDSIFTGSIRPGDFHPTRDGQTMMARLVRCYLDAHPSSPYLGTTPPPKPAKGTLPNVGDAVGTVDVGRTGRSILANATSGDGCSDNDATITATDD